MNSSILGGIFLLKNATLLRKLSLQMRANDDIILMRTNTPDNYSCNRHTGDAVSIVSMGSMEPINFLKRVLEINLESSINIAWLFWQ